MEGEAIRNRATDHIASTMMIVKVLISKEKTRMLSCYTGKELEPVMQEISFLEGQLDGLRRVKKMVTEGGAAR